MNDPKPASVLFISGDLMFGSRIKGAAQNAGLGFQVGLSGLPEDADHLQYVILDLATKAELTQVVVDQCKQRCPEAKLIAFGPHVQVGKIRAAKDAGFPTVLTRSQFDSGLGSLFVS